jgi:hypothetical protein
MMLMYKPWTQHLSDSQASLLWRITTHLKPNNQLDLTFNDILSMCRIKNKNELIEDINGMIELGVIIKSDEIKDKPYFFSRNYIEYDEIGPKIYQRNLIKITKASL